ncbi:GAF and ANTAR domain-containing protein [Planomonospora sp. ID67723]|uniref:GAF and ANTAR domain-containing protein n=1 Tax=Planomonospora sp. ID67723 TaxID=2738134 RepID=UPI0018C43195|nr:GAF and ANTAR domain-containing protein [Planomonospora sp. ID67723]MBG0829672.1 GAF and ANTAR domain-containing protein [Planomonospora sp. ID67723]
MSSSGRRLTRTLVELADTLSDDFDIVGYLDALARHGAGLPGVAACTVLLAGPDGLLSTVAASGEEARLLGLAQVRHGEGPCLDSYRGRRPVSCPDPASAARRWPRFAPVAAAAGFAAVHTLPMRLRVEAVGAMSLFRVAPGMPDAQTAKSGQALADMAAIGILHQRAVRHQESVTGQLQLALNSRILIEQAKGLLAGRLNLAPEQAFVILRGYARAHNLKLTTASQALIGGKLSIPLPGGAPIGP